MSFLKIKNKNQIFNRVFVFYDTLKGNASNDVLRNPAALTRRRNLQFLNKLNPFLMRQHLQYLRMGTVNLAGNGYGIA